MAIAVLNCNAVHRVIAREGFVDKNHKIRINHSLNFLELIHEVNIGVDSSGRVCKHNVFVFLRARTAPRHR